MMARWIRPYRAILRQQMIAGLQFRANFWGRLITNIFWGYVRATIIWVFYVWGSGDSALTMESAIAMIWLGQIAGNLLPGWGVDMSVWNKITTGDVGYELARPMDVFGQWYASCLASKLAPFLLAVAPVGLVALLVPGPLGLSLPASPLHLAACVLTLMTGLLLSCSAVCISYAMAMDVRIGSSPALFFNSFIQMLAGGFLPLQLWPQWAQRLLYYQPFAGIMDLPLRFYVGSAQLPELLTVIPLQLLWAIILGFLARCWIQRNLRKLVLQGG